MSFRGLSGDFLELGDATELPPAGLLASTTGLTWTRPNINEGTAMAFLGWQDWVFVQNARVGDTIRVEQRVHALRPSSSRLDRGVVTFAIRVVNHRDELLQHGNWSPMWGRRAV